jgi:Anti-sigma-K factor rskA
VPAHCDPDDLALIALGEPAASPVDESHLAGCARCQSELEQLRGVVATGRSASPDDTPEPPPAYLWMRIVDELGLPAASESVPTLASRRRPPGWRAVAGVAAAAAAIGVLATLGVQALTGSEDSGRLVARVALTPLPDHRGTGTASVVRVGSSRSLDLTVRGLTKADGFYEVWLLDKDAKRLVSLGLLRGTHGQFTLPAGVDLRDYPVVDVSIEPADGNPAHSGNSVVRGQLPS